MLSKIKDILIIVNKGELSQYKKIIPNGKNLGIKITYAEQSEPRGLPDAFIIGEKFIGSDNVALILGDNFFYGQNLTTQLLNYKKLKKGAKIILHKVKKPDQYGVAKINKKYKVTHIKEKPKKFISDLAITGLYFFDNLVCKYSKWLKPSKRGEVEIVDLLNFYPEIEEAKGIVKNIVRDLNYFNTIAPEKNKSYFINEDNRDELPETKVIKKTNIFPKIQVDIFLTIQIFTKILITLIIIKLREEIMSSIMKKS